MRFILVFLCCALIMCPAGAAEGLDAKIDRALDRYDTLGASIAVFQNGRITYTHVYGDRAIGGEPVTEDTLFQVGSIAKMVGNMGLMQLLEKQGIPLEAEIGDVLGYRVRHPEFPNAPVTLRQLMTHTASLQDSADYRQALAGTNGKPLRTLFEKRGEYTFISGCKPGTRRQYSNLGGGLIGSLIEKLSGQTVDDYMTENVFAPLGIQAAYLPSRFEENAPFADLYQMPRRWLTKRLRDEQLVMDEPDPETHYFLTAGKLIISAPDLCKLLIALCDGGVYENVRLLKESTVSEMTAVQNRRGSVDCDSGHGLFLNIITDHQVEGRTLYGHGGKANGMLCAAYFDPADRTGVVMLTNGCRNTAVHNGVGMLGRVVLTLCYDEWINPAHRTEDPFAVE